jgi:hypothetical protein
LYQIAPENNHFLSENNEMEEQSWNKIFLHEPVWQASFISFVDSIYQIILNYLINPGLCRLNCSCCVAVKWNNKENTKLEVSWVGFEMK